MKKAKRRSRLMALLLATVMLALLPVKVQAAPTPTTTGVTQSDFDAQRYADTYPDLKKAFGYNEALLWQHYQQFGSKEGRQVFVKGDAAPASATAVTTPAATVNGLTQTTFDAKRYADMYADLKKAFGYNEALLWQHYQKYGMKEGRHVFAKGATTPATAATGAQAATPAPTATAATGLTQANFDAKRYADTYADLKKAFGYNEALLWQHYQKYGIKEGRRAFAKGAAAPAVTTATAPVAPAAATATSSNFLSKEGGYDIARYAVSIGAKSSVRTWDVVRAPGNGWDFGTELPAGWKADIIDFCLWDGKDYWECRAWNTKVQVPPIATAQARTFAEAKAFFDRFRP
ncbi:MAG: hypothetical protein IJR00_12720 [Lachnospiraceae bacterium]|nr:hypothetical protein [Lachnospiraceae bacterium]